MAVGVIFVSAFAFAMFADVPVPEVDNRTSVTEATVATPTVAQTPSPAPPVADPGAATSVDVPAASADATEQAHDIDKNEIVVSGQKRVPGDPLAEVNAESFAVTAAIDEAAFAPVAREYKKAVPQNLRGGVRNFFNNLHEPVAFINFVLQLKIGKAFETAGRFAINSTLGLGGLIDIAKRRTICLPHRRNGFANTLGFYGVKQGAFVFLPLIGPSTVRDIVGGTLDRLVLPVAVGTPFGTPEFAIPTGALSAVDRRAENDEKITKLRDGSVDAYAASRSTYLTRRQAEIDALRGKGYAASNPEPVAGCPPARRRANIAKRHIKSVQPS